MKYFLALLVFGIVCQNTFAIGLENAVLNDFERRLVRLESRQFSESENLEHRMLQLEIQIQRGEETLQSSPLEISKEEEPSESVSFLQRLEKVEKKWEKELEEQLAQFSSKYDSLSERFSAVERHLEEQGMEGKLSEKPESAENKSDESGESEERSLEKFQRIGTKYYYIESNNRKTWLAALNECESINAKLVSLQNEEEWNELKEALVPDHSYWTDINDRIEENKFVSGKSDNLAPFLRWDDYEPNSTPGAEDCVEMRSDHDYKMNDVSCNEEKYYICEIDNEDNL